LPVIGKEIDRVPLMRHHMDTIDLLANRLTEEDVRSAEHEADRWLQKVEQEKEKLAKHPELRQKPYWYRDLTSAARHEQWARNVATRYKLQVENPFLPAEIHVLRMGEVVFASVPF